MAEPDQYPGGKELITFGEVTGDSRVKYFARYTNESLDKIKIIYLKWARLGNAMGPQCQQPNRLFSQCVDGNHIRIPENLEAFKDLEDTPDPKLTMALFILDSLHEACVTRTGTLGLEIQDNASNVRNRLTTNTRKDGDFGI